MYGIRDPFSQKSDMTPLPRLYCVALWFLKIYESKKRQDRGPESYSSEHAKNLRFTATIFCPTLWVFYLNIFTLSTQNKRLKKILDIFIYLKYNRQTSQLLLKAKTGTNIFNLTLSITFGSQWIRPSTFFYLIL